MIKSEAVVREFWRLMASNDFCAVQAVLTEGFVLEWPQSAECIRGPQRFAQMNAEYPAHGAWTFRIDRLVATESEVVTRVSVSDGVQQAEAISFFSIEGDRIGRIVEFWPQAYEAPANRRHLTEPLS